jgi:hypothetical protein
LFCLEGLIPTYTLTTPGLRTERIFITAPAMPPSAELPL